jgi:hypothetical protein
MKKEIFYIFLLFFFLCVDGRLFRDYYRVNAILRIPNVLQSGKTKQSLKNDMISDYSSVKILKINIFNNTHWTSIQVKCKIGSSNYTVYVRTGMLCHCSQLLFVGKQRLNIVFRQINRNEYGMNVNGILLFRNIVLCSFVKSVAMCSDKTMWSLILIHLVTQMYLSDW